MALAYYSTTRPGQLAAALDGTSATVVLLDGSTFPDPGVTGKQYTVIIGYGSDREEVCTVTAKPSATTLTVTRGQDGTPATAKNAGDTVVHGVSARDFERLNSLDAAVVALQSADTALQAADTALQGRVTVVENALPGKVNDTGDTLTGSLAMGGNKITGLGAATGSGDALSQGAGDGRYVSLTGGTMTGDLSVAKTTGGAFLSVKSPDNYAEVRTDSVGTQASGLTIKQDGIVKWKWMAQAASHDLGVARYDSAGIYLDMPFRVTVGGEVRILTDPVNALGVATKQYVDAAGYVINLSGNIASSVGGQTQLAYLSGAAGWGSGITRSGNGIKVTNAGWYEVSFNGGIASAGGGTVRMMGVWGSGGAGDPLGTNSIAAYGPPASTSGWGSPLSATGLVYLNANDTVYVWARQDTGSTITATATLCVSLSRAG